MSAKWEGMQAQKNKPSSSFVSLLKNTYKNPYATKAEAVEDSYFQLGGSTRLVL